MLFGLKNRNRVNDRRNKKKIEDDYSNEEFDFNEGFKTNDQIEEENINEQSIKESKEDLTLDDYDLLKDKNNISNNLVYLKTQNSKLEKLKNINFKKNIENKPKDDLDFYNASELNEQDSNQFFINRKRKFDENLKIEQRDITGINDFLIYDIEKNNIKNLDNGEKINYDFIKPYHVNNLTQMKIEKNQEKNKSNRDTTVYDYDNIDYFPDSNVNIIDEDNFDNKIYNKTTKEISKNINKYNKFFENSDEIYLNDSNQEIKSVEHSESSEDPKRTNLQKEIQKIKDLRSKKRQIQHKDETYDQDFVEIKNIKTDLLLNDVYKMIDNQDYGPQDSVSESEKEILQWEMEKLKNGMSSKNNRVSLYNRKPFKQEKEEQKDQRFNINETETNIKSYFKKINTNVNLHKFVKSVKNQCENEEKIIEHEYSKIDSINNKIKRTKELKELNFRKIDFYVNQYKKMKSFYIEIIKLQKKKKDINIPKVLEYLDNEELNLSE